MEYRLAAEENTYENTELLQSLLNLYSSCFNYCQGDANKSKQTTISKQYIILTTELILSILTIWSEYSAFTEAFVYELCYRYYNTIRNRSAILHLLSTILKTLNQSDKTLFNTAIKVLVSPYKARKYERKVENKDRDPTQQKERKSVPILKIHHHDEFFGEYFPQEMPLFEYLLNSFLEAKSTVFEAGLDRFLEAVFM